MTKSKQGTVAREFCEKFTSEPSRTVAKSLHAAHPKLFPSVEQARSAVRRARGNHGSRNRKVVSDKSLFRPNGKAGIVTCPEPVTDKWQTLKIDGPASVGVLSDIHIPFQHRSALETSIAACKNHRCDTIILNGDILDFTKISKFQADPEEREPAEEIRDCIKFMMWIRQEFPKARLIFKEGNHDLRWSHYIWRNAPVLWQLQQVRLNNLLGWLMAEETGNETVKLDRYGWEYLPNASAILCGHLPVLHGNELKVNSGGVNPARAAYLKTAHTVLIGHLHKTSQHTEPEANFDEDVRSECATFSTGCLCSLRPGYHPVGNKWNHGFAIVDVANNREFDVRNHRISNGKIRAS